MLALIGEWPVVGPLADRVVVLCYYIMDYMVLIVILCCIVI